MRFVLYVSLEFCGAAVLSSAEFTSRADAEYTETRRACGKIFAEGVFKVSGRSQYYNRK